MSPTINIFGGVVHILLTKPEPGEEPEVEVTPSDILQRVAAEAGITSELILGDSRGVEAVRARDRVIWLLRMDLGMGPSEIGRFLNRDHSTILHSIKKTGEAMLHPVP